MTVSNAELQAVQVKLITDCPQPVFIAALNTVTDALQEFPYSVWCAVGKMVAEEGAYQYLSEGVEESGLRTVPNDESHTAENLTTLREKV